MPGSSARRAVSIRAALAVAFAAVLIGSSCAPVESSDAIVTGACGPADNTCRAVVSVALERLGPVRVPIERVRRAYPACDPAARCAAAAQDQGAVVIWFATGEPVMVRVYSERRPDGVGFRLVADVPEPVPAALLQLIEGAA